MLSTGKSLKYKLFLIFNAMHRGMHSRTIQINLVHFSVIFLLFYHFDVILFYHFDVIMEIYMPLVTVINRIFSAADENSVLNG